MRINRTQELEPLGTIGSSSPLREHLDEPFLGGGQMSNVDDMSRPYGDSRQGLHLLHDDPNGTLTEGRAPCSPICSISAAKTIMFVFRQCPSCAITAFP